MPDWLAATAIMNAILPLPVSCPNCEARMPQTAAFCPGCGKRMVAALSIQESRKENVGLLAENVAGALAYFTLVPAIVFLLREPYRANRFVRLHSVHCLLFRSMGALVVLALKVA